RGLVEQVVDGVGRRREAAPNYVRLRQGDPRRHEGLKPSHLIAHGDIRAGEIEAPRGAPSGQTRRIAGVRSNANDDIIGEYMIVADETAAPEAAFDALARDRENLAADIEPAPNRRFLRL